MEPELRELLDKQAIAELLYAYGEGIDRRDHKLLETVFTEDCQPHYGAYDHPARFLIDSWRADLPPAFLMTHHLYGNIVVRFHGADRARSITYFWSRIAPADSTNWWDAPGNPSKVGAHGQADPASGFLDAGAVW